MKKYFSLFIIAAGMSIACGPEEAKVDFDVKVDTEDGRILVGPEGGMKTFKVTSAGDWTISSEDSWISVSPATGRGETICKVQIDSALLDTERSGAIHVKSIDGTADSREVEVVQEGFEYQIILDETSVDVEDYADYGSRYFEVKVKANVQFDVELSEESQKWLSYKKSDLNLDREKRPRESVVRFDWRVNSRDFERVAEVVFRPKDEVAMGRHDALTVTQKAALPIPENTREGDSLAILAIHRALNGFIEFDTTEKLDHWRNVSVWKDGPHKGRVRYVQFFMFNTKESLPYEVQYLTAAEEIAFYSNANQFLKSLDTGEWIARLTQLKRLTIGAYGLTSLHPDMVNLKNLEYLNLSSNCFQEIPDILTPENFPNLRVLVLNANPRNTIYDLSNDIRVKEGNVGGFIDEPSFPVDLLKWNKLDTLVLSVNYLHGVLPDMQYEEGVDMWTEEEVHACDTLPDVLIGLPKVLPDTDFFAINYNRLSGKIPDWLLYHPKLDWWIPYSLIFPQEGKTKDGQKSGFENEPVSLDYYYEHYVNKKNNPNK